MEIENFSLDSEIINISINSTETVEELQRLIDFLTYYISSQNQLTSTLKQKVSSQLKFKLLGLKEKDFFEVSNSSNYFQKMMTQYNKSMNHHIIFPNINSLINDYRSEKINSLSEREILKDDLGDDLRKFKQLQSITDSSKLILKNSNNKKMKY